MGIAFSFLPFLDACFEQRALLSPVLALGALKIHEPPERIAALAGEHAYAHLARDHSVRALLRDRYEVSAYQDCDVNGLADLHLDLGKPLDETWDGRFGTVLNGGTVEHVFDVRQAMTNIHRLVRPGGTMIHLAPVTWIDHAFVNFNPKLFRSIAEANQYEIVLEDFHVPPAAENPAEEPRRYGASNGHPHETMTRRLPALLNALSVPSNMLYMVVLRKTTEAEFAVPYDVAAS